MLSKFGAKFCQIFSPYWCSSEVTITLILFYQGFYSIKSVLSGLTLDIEAQGGSGSKVIPWEFHGGDNQIWYDDPATGTIRSKWNNCALTVESKKIVLQFFHILIKLFALYYYYYLTICRCT